jgi:hypothetical protein
MSLEILHDQYWLWWNHYSDEAEARHAAGSLGLADGQFRILATSGNVPYPGLQTD